jgi:hypothetical protein
MAQFNIHIEGMEALVPNPQYEVNERAAIMIKKELEKINAIGINSAEINAIMSNTGVLPQTDKYATSKTTPYLSKTTSLKLNALVESSKIDQPALPVAYYCAAQIGYVLGYTSVFASQSPQARKFSVATNGSYLLLRSILPPYLIATIEGRAVNTVQSAMDSFGSRYFLQIMESVYEEKKAYRITNLLASLNRPAADDTQLMNAAPGDLNAIGILRKRLDDTFTNIVNDDSIFESIKEEIKRWIAQQTNAPVDTDNLNDSVGGHLLEGSFDSLPATNTVKSLVFRLLANKLRYLYSGRQRFRGQIAHMPPLAPPIVYGPALPAPNIDEQAFIQEVQEVVTWMEANPTDQYMAIFNEEFLEETANGVFLPPTTAQHTYPKLNLTFVANRPGDIPTTELATQVINMLAPVVRRLADVYRSGTFNNDENIGNDSIARVIQMENFATSAIRDYYVYNRVYNRLASIAAMLNYIKSPGFLDVPIPIGGFPVLNLAERRAIENRTRDYVTSTFLYKTGRLSQSFLSALTRPTDPSTFAYVANSENAVRRNTLYTVYRTAYGDLNEWNDVNPIETPEDHFGRLTGIPAGGANTGSNRILEALPISLDNYDDVKNLLDYTKTVHWFERAVMNPAYTTTVAEWLNQFREHTAGMEMSVNPLYVGKLLDRARRAYFYTVGGSYPVQQFLHQQKFLSNRLLKQALVRREQLKMMISPTVPTTLVINKNKNDSLPQVFKIAVTTQQPLVSIEAVLKVTYANTSDPVVIAVKAPSSVTEKLVSPSPSTDVVKTYTFEHSVQWTSAGTYVFTVNYVFKSGPERDEIKRSIHSREVHIRECAVCPRDNVTFDTNQLTQSFGECQFESSYGRCRILPFHGTSNSLLSIVPETPEEDYVQAAYNTQSKMFISEASSYFRSFLLKGVEHIIRSYPRENNTGGNVLPDENYRALFESTDYLFTDGPIPATSIVTRDHKFRYRILAARRPHINAGTHFLRLQFCPASKFESGYNLFTVPCDVSEYEVTNAHKSAIVAILDTPNTETAKRIGAPRNEYDSFMVGMREITQGHPNLLNQVPNIDTFEEILTNILPLELAVHVRTSVNNKLGPRRYSNAGESELYKYQLGDSRLLYSTMVHWTSPAHVFNQNMPVIAFLALMLHQPFSNLLVSYMTPLKGDALMKAKSNMTNSISMILRAFHNYVEYIALDNIKRSHISLSGNMKTVAMLLAFKLPTVDLNTIVAETNYSSQSRKISSVSNAFVDAPSGDIIADLFNPNKSAKRQADKMIDILNAQSGTYRTAAVVNSEGDRLTDSRERWTSTRDLVNKKSSLSAPMGQGIDARFITRADESTGYALGSRGCWKGFHSMSHGTATLSDPFDPTFAIDLTNWGVEGMADVVNTINELKASLMARFMQIYAANFEDPAGLCAPETIFYSDPVSIKIMSKLVTHWSLLSVLLVAPITRQTSTNGPVSVFQKSPSNAVIRTEIATSSSSSRNSAAYSKHLVTRDKIDVTALGLENRVRNRLRAAGDVALLADNTGSIFSTTLFVFFAEVFLTRFRKTTAFLNLFAATEIRVVPLRIPDQPTRFPQEIAYINLATFPAAVPLLNALLVATQQSSVSEINGLVPLLAAIFTAAIAAGHPRYIANLRTELTQAEINRRQLVKREHATTALITEKIRTLVVPNPRYGALDNAYMNRRLLEFAAYFVAANLPGGNTTLNTAIAAVPNNATIDPLLVASIGQGMATVPVIPAGVPAETAYRAQLLVDYVNMFVTAIPNSPFTRLHAYTIGEYLDINNTNRSIGRTRGELINDIRLNTGAAGLLRTILLDNDDYLTALDNLHTSVNLNLGVGPPPVRPATEIIEKATKAILPTLNDISNYTRLPFISEQLVMSRLKTTLLITDANYDAIMADAAKRGAYRRYVTDIFAPHERLYKAIDEENLNRNVFAVSVQHMLNTQEYSTVRLHVQHVMVASEASHHLFRLLTAPVGRVGALAGQFLPPGWSATRDALNLYMIRDTLLSVRENGYKDAQLQHTVADLNVGGGVATLPGAGRRRIEPQMGNFPAGWPVLQAQAAIDILRNAAERDRRNLGDFNFHDNIMTVFMLNPVELQQTADTSQQNIEVIFVEQTNAVRRVIYVPGGPAVLPRIYLFVNHTNEYFIIATNTPNNLHNIACPEQHVQFETQTMQIVLGGYPIEMAQRLVYSNALDAYMRYNKHVFREITGARRRLYVDRTKMYSTRPKTSLIRLLETIYLIDPVKQTHTTPLTLGIQNLDEIVDFMIGDTYPAQDPVGVYVEGPRMLALLRVEAIKRLRAAAIAALVRRDFITRLIVDPTLTAATHSALYERLITDSYLNSKQIFREADIDAEIATYSALPGFAAENAFRAAQTAYVAVAKAQVTEAEKRYTIAESAILASRTPGGSVSTAITTAQAAVAAGAGAAAILAGTTGAFLGIVGNDANVYKKCYALSEAIKAFYELKMVDPANQIPGYPAANNKDTQCAYRNGYVDKLMFIAAQHYINYINTYKHATKAAIYPTGYTHLFTQNGYCDIWNDLGLLTAGEKDQYFPTADTNIAGYTFLNTKSLDFIALTPTENTDYR